MTFEDSHVVRNQTDHHQGEGGEKLGKVTLSGLHGDDTAYKEQKAEPGYPRHPCQEPSHSQHHR